MRWLLSLCLFTCVLPVHAHPLPNLRYDRVVEVKLSETGVTVNYALDLNEWTMVIDGSKLLEPAAIAGVKGARDYLPIYAKRKSEIVADNLISSLDGKLLKFRVEKIEPTHDRDHLQLRFVLRADWSPTKGKKQSFQFEDHNFEDVSGKMFLVMKESSEIEVGDREEPEGLRGRSPLELKPDDVPRLRRCSAVFTIAEDTKAAATPVPSKSTDIVTAPPPPPAPVEKPGLMVEMYNRGLPALLDSELGVGILLLASMLYGMAHAFAPGHGKTMVAAYLIGERGTVKHALILALSTTATHTGTVLIVAGMLWLAYGNAVPSSAQGWLHIVGGLMIFGIGLWLLVCRVTGRADHVHMFGDHHHHHGEHGHHHHGEPGHVHGPDCDHTHGPEANSDVSWVRLVLMGIGGGLIPCWGAVLLLIGSVAYGRVSLGLPLVLAFSVGLGVTLVALGLIVVRAHAHGAEKFSHSRLFKLLPIIGALLVTIIGLWLAREGAQLLFSPPPPGQEHHS